MFFSLLSKEFINEDPKGLGLSETWSTCAGGARSLTRRLKSFFLETRGGEGSIGRNRWRMGGPCSDFAVYVPLQTSQQKGFITIISGPWSVFEPPKRGQIYHHVHDHHVHESNVTGMRYVNVSKY